MAAPSQAPLDRRAIFYMALLALQFGIQPVLTRRYTSTGITRSSVILVQEIIKFGMAASMLYLSGGTKAALSGWTVGIWLAVAGIPAALYAVQNIAALTAYQNLDALTFNVLNQTKTLSAALCCYLVMGRRQSGTQVFSLLLLLLAALIIEGVVQIDWIIQQIRATDGDDGGDGDGETTGQDGGRKWEARHFTHGVGPVLLASFISGLAGALSQKNLQASAGGGRNPYLFSMELCAATCLVLLSSLAVSPDGRKISENGFWNGWTVETFIPIVTNSAGGIVVGLVTKYAGSVRKGFALIFGILLSGVIQALLQTDQGVTKEQVMGGCLAAASLYMHSVYPPKASPRKEEPKKPVKQD